MSKVELTLEEIAKNYSDLNAKLEADANAMREEINVVVNKRIRDIRARKEMMDVFKQKAIDYIEAHPEEFTKPKTQVLHGIKLGLRKQKGKPVIADEAALIAKLEKDYDGVEGVLVKTTKTVIKKGLEALPAKELKRLGISIQDVDDKVVFDITQDGIDELLSIINFGEAS